jgi:tight adherence protein B
MNIQAIAIGFLAFVALLGVLSVFVYPYLSGDARAEKRQRAIVGPERSKGVSSSARANEVSKRDQVLQSLKEMEDKQKRARTPPLSVQLLQAGVTWSKNFYYVFSVVVAVVFGAAAFYFSQNLYVTAGALLVGGFGFPRLYLSRKKKSRIGKFAEEFPNALDVIVRGVKAGLPLGDCVRIIALEASEPVKGEFRQVMETQTMGIALPDAVMRIYERMPCAEANFFGIVIAIQQKAGGNLSEALGNLSKVLRERKKMRAKIKAVSTEAKASAMIIGALPIIVMTLVYITTPKYIALLWQTNSGNIMLLVSAFWMALGILVMKKMINFDI